MAGPVEKTASFSAGVFLGVEVLLVGQVAEHRAEHGADHLRREVREDHHEGLGNARAELGDIAVDPQADGDCRVQVGAR